MSTRFVITWVGLALSLACAKNVRAEPPPAPVAVDKARANPSPPAAEKVPPATGAGEATPPVPALPVPLTKGKRIRITRLHQIKPLEVMVPDGVTLRMDYMDGGDILPRAQLHGGSVDLTVGPTESEFMPLSFYTKNLKPSEVIIHGVETPDGLLLLKKSISERRPPSFLVLVTRPTLEVQCYQSNMKSLVDAQVAASVCLSLKSAK